MSREESRLLSAAGKWLREEKALAICLSVAAFATLVILFNVPLFNHLLAVQDLHLQDQYFVWRDALGLTGASDAHTDSDIVLVSIDNESARRLGMALPWPRQMYAYLTKRLRDAGARVIAFNVLFDGPSPARSSGNIEPSARLRAFLPPDILARWSSSVSGDDQALANEFKVMRNIVLADNVEVNFNLLNGRSQFSFHLPYDPFLYALGFEAGSIGNASVAPDEDGIVRRAPLVFDRFSNVLVLRWSFGLRVAEKAEQLRAADVPGGKILFAGRVIPHIMRINFQGPPGTIKSIPFWRALRWEEHFGSNPFRGKIVIIGYQDFLTELERTAPELVPNQSALPVYSFLTPVASMARPLSGVELQANVVTDVLSGRYLTEPEPWEEVLIVLLAALLVARVTRQLHGRPWSALAAIAGCCGIWLACSFLSFCFLRSVIPVVVPIFGVALPAWLLVLTDQNLTLVAERRKHTKIFRYLAAKDLAAEIDRRQLGELGLNGKTALITTMSCQLQNMVAVTEGKPPEEVIKMAHECITSMFTCVYDCHGLVNRLSSYGIMAIWGAPLPNPEESQCTLAARTALALQRKFSDLSSAFRQQGRIAENQSLWLSLGLSTDEASCGRIGTESHPEYSVVGKGVDLSILLEALNKRYGTACLLSERTARVVAQNFEIRELDRLKLNPAERPVYIYELLCEKGNLSGAMDEAMALYRQGTAAMEERNFAEAEQLFSTMLRLASEDRPAMLMLSRCREYRLKPPEADWDGSVLVADIL